MRENGGRARQAGESLWRFSLALYARPGVAAALLALQDRVGCDVNLILFALGLGAEARALDAPGLRAAAAAIAPLNTAIVHPLRRLRRELKGAVESDLQSLRGRILNLELAAERQAQQRLAATVADRPAGSATTRIALAESNLAVCVGEEASSPEANVLRQAVAALMRAA